MLSKIEIYDGDGRSNIESKIKAPPAMRRRE